MVSQTDVPDTLHPPALENQGATSKSGGGGAVLKETRSPKRRVVAAVSIRNIGPTERKRRSW
jgi:hypothetical protein